MTYTVTNGYSPRSYETILTECVHVVNEQFGTSYTNQSFTGTNLWKYLYATIQGLMTVENNIAELGVKLQDYIRTQNEELIIPTSSENGFTALLEREMGLIASFKPTESSADAGQIYLAIDIDNTAEDYAEKKQQIFNLMAEHLGAGLFYNGTEQGTVTELNGQSFNYAFDLPTETNLKVKIQVRVSENTNLFVETTNKIKEKFLANFAKAYRLGYDFEPQVYLCKDDLPFASEIKVTYQSNGSYSGEVLNSAYDEKIIITENNVEVEVIS